MLISEESLHFKYFKFLKRFENSFSNIMDFDQNRPFDHYVFFNRIRWCSRFCNKIKVFDSLLKYDDNFISLLKNFINRIILYQCWGSFVVFSIIQILKTFEILQLNSIIENLLVGYLPIFLIIILFGIFSTLWEFVVATNLTARKKFDFNRRIKQQYESIISYTLYILLSPILFLFLILLEILARVIVTFLFYQVIGVKLFLEQIWLFINIIVVIIVQTSTSLKHKLQRKRDKPKESRLRNFLSFKLKK